MDFANSGDRSVNSPRYEAAVNKVPAEGRLQQFGPEDLVAVRLLQLFVFSADRDATPVGEDRKRKSKQLLKAVHAAHWSGEESPAHFDLLQGLTTVSNDRLHHSISEALEALGQHLHGGRGVPLTLEAFTAFKWKKGLSWAEGQPEKARNRALRALGRAFADIDSEAVLDAHRSAVKRLNKDKLSPAAQMGIGSFIAVATVASAGAATAVGTAIGTHMFGLSGAAATSAGLAWLGGGSIAAGGFGMAGGSLLVGLGAHGAQTLGRNFVGSILAKESSSAFIYELAKLDVQTRFDPSLTDELRSSLAALQDELKRELMDNWPEREGRVTRNLERAGFGKPWATLVPMLRTAELVKNAKEIWEDRPRKAERNVAAAERAVDYELRHLDRPEWKRMVAKVPRGMGFPALNKLLDELPDELW